MAKSLDDLKKDIARLRARRDEAASELAGKKALLAERTEKLKEFGVESVEAARKMLGVMQQKDEILRDEIAEKIKAVKAELLS